MKPSRMKISLLLILVIIFSFSFGVTTMQMDKDGNMSDCPFMGMDAICQMDIFEHIGAFQNVFTVIPGKSILFVIVLALVLVSLAIKRQSGIPPDNLRFFTRESLRLPNFNKILLALSDGVIQPKLYNNA